MKFGPVRLDEAEGAIAAHSVRLAGAVVKKGEILTRDALGKLREAGHETIVVARLEDGDVHEDEAAERVARWIKGPGIRVEPAFTGRSNLYAETAGVLRVDAGIVNALNRINPGVTVATLPEFAGVEAGRMVATVKIIPFALPAGVLEDAGRLAKSAREPILSVAVWRPLKVGLVATILPGLKPSVMDKTRRVLEERLAPAGARILDEIRVEHQAEAVADALRTLRQRGADLLLVFGASAITDEEDVIPAAIREAGGDVVHFGMPVDPGNLLLLGRLSDAPVLGAPGCARSPKENGFDWVLARLLAGLEVTPDDITAMGVGGLLMEIVSRPQPRESVATKAGPVAAIVLAAGRSRRMGGPNKLLATFEGIPLVRRVAEAALKSRASPVIVVTGHMREEVEAALAGLPVTLVHNPDFAEGFATSIRTGMAAVPAEVAGALMVLADMPGVRSDLLDALISRFEEGQGRAVVVPTRDGKQGNPVLWPRAFFPDLSALSGDAGAKHLLGRHVDSVSTIEVGRAAMLDVDTPEALRQAGGSLPAAP